MPRSLCTILLMLLWGLVVLAVAMCHSAITQVVPPLKDMPANIQKGFYDVLKFDSLHADAESVRASAAVALQRCAISTAQCSSLPSTSAKSTTTTEKQEIQDAFNRTLNTILKVATDKYFGTPDMADVAVQLQQIVDDLESVDGNDQYCAATNEVYCDIWTNADSIVDGTGKVKTQIDLFCNTDEMKTWEKHGKQMKLLHGLPYFFVVAMLLFTLFWCRDAACICCGGSCLGSVAAFLFFIFWLIFYTFSLIVCIVGYVIRNKSDEIMINGVFAENVSLKALLDHIEGEYVDFWNLVFNDLVVGLVTFNRAFVLFLGAGSVVILYGCCICLCRPYTSKKQDAKESTIAVMPAPKIDNFLV